jgi:endonuclease YncB( thermonuclease family)
VRKFGVLLGVVACLLLPVFTPPAHAEQGWETGTVVSVMDGDTFTFKEEGTGILSNVRLIGVNTPEVTGFQNKHYPKNYCGSLEASSYLKSILPPGTKVQLWSNSKESSNRGRIQRTVMAFNSQTGQYDTDIAARVLQAGWGLWFTVGNEPTRSAEYRRLFESAFASKSGIWRPGLCGPLEQPSASLSLRIVWDAAGNDAVNVNGEYTVILNTGETVDLSGWLLRDSSIEYWFTFPQGSVLPPGGRFIVHAGQGISNGTDFYMGSPIPIFPNVTPGSFLGDGIYLTDRSDAYRFIRVYPCLDCVPDTLAGALSILKVNPKVPKGTVDRANAEYVRIVNRSLSPVCLDGYFIRRKVSTYNFPPGTCLGPNAKVTVRIGKGADAPGQLHWGQASTLLNDAHDCVELVSDLNVVLDFRRW